MKTHARFCCSLLVLFVLAVLPARAQFAVQEIKLIGTGGLLAQQGCSVALSADGSTAIVGGSNDNTYVGAVWIYTQSGGVWTQQGGKLVGTGAVGKANQGSSVALSSDGNTAIVGGPTDNSNVGAAWVFTRTGGVWTQQGSKLVGSGSVGNTFQGTSVSLSGDGNTAIIGGDGDNSYAGAAWVFTQTAGVWTQQGFKLVGTGATAGFVAQGRSVSLSADGNTAIVGGPSDNSSVGAAWVYTRTADVWTQLGAKLVGTGNVGSSSQGYSVSLSADGNTAVVGGVQDSSNVGAVWIYTQSGGVWTQQGVKLVGMDHVGSSSIGGSVSLSSDGNTAIVGGFNDNGSAGAAWVYERRSGVWNQKGNKIVGTGAVGNALQGISVSLSSDGHTAIVGGYNDNGSKGAAWVFSLVKVAIASISDVPADQGGEVRLKWNRFVPDSLGSKLKIASYGIWRKIPPASSAAKHKRLVPPLGISALLDDSLSQYDYLMTVNAVQIPYYNVVVPTLADSSTSGIPYFTYLLTVHTTDPSDYFVSDPDSGYSVDNLSPIPPSGVLASVQPAPLTQLTWNRPTDPDVGHYDVYRSPVGGFDPDPSFKIGTSLTYGYIDSGVTTGNEYHYRIIAVDVHGNQSLPSNEVVAVFPVSQSYSVSSNWNIVSVPLIPGDFTKTVLYPSAVSEAFTYAGSYMISPILQNGVGYWLRFDANQVVPISGQINNVDTVVVADGWNMIGSISSPVAVSSIMSIPSGLATSQFFGYNNGYQVASFIQPGSGYWVKVNGSGNLILNSSGITTASRIRITPISERPPSPPDGSNGLIPKVFALEQNYPNPYNPSTVITYSLPTSSHVQLTIYNMLGQKVETLVDEMQEAGYKSLSFNAVNLPSGVYTYRLTAGTFMQTRKMVLIK